MAISNLRLSHGRPAWKLFSNRAEAWVTRAGGHLGPVTFRLENRRIEPLALAPWLEEKQARTLDPLMSQMGGDFFCMPFGGNAQPLGREKHPAHGETAQGNWRLIQHEGNRARWEMKTKIRRARVTKEIWLAPDETVVYQRHIIAGLKGRMNLGHHAILQFPPEEGSGRISTSGFSFGQVYPGRFEDPAQGGYSCLKPGARFSSLTSVPLAEGGRTDLSLYPARRGYTDVVMVVSRPRPSLAWTAVTFSQQRYVWFALKDPRVLRQTVFWISNGGRHYAPWSGRHLDCMGIEEVTSHFHDGLAESVQANALSRRGIPTALTFDPQHPTEINYIMGVAEIPRGFDEVKSIEPSARGVILSSVSGKKTSARVTTAFLRGASPV